MCDFICIIDWIFMVLWPPSFLLYILVMIVLIKHRKTVFEASFFKLCLSLGVADLAMLCHVWWLKVAKWGYYRDTYLAGGDAMATFMGMGIWVLLWTERFGVFMLTINRYTVIVWNKPELWTPSIIKKAIALQWFLGTVVGLLAVKPGYEFKPHLSNTSLFASSADFVYHKQYYRVTNAYNALSIIVSICMYASMTRVVYTTLKSANSSQTVAKELRLAACGLCVLCVEMVQFSFFAYFSSIFGLVTAKELVTFGVIMDEVYAWCNAYLLIAFCSAVREKLLEFLGAGGRGPASSRASRGHKSSNRQTGGGSSKRVSPRQK